MLSDVGRFIYTKYWGILYVEHGGKIIYTKYWGLLYFEHCGKIYLHKILRNTLCWTLWGDLFTQNTVCWTQWKALFTQNTEEYFLLNTVGIFIYIKYLEIGCIEHCEKIYLHKILGNTLCWALWEYLFTQNTGNYFMLNTVGRCIYTKYRRILYVEHYRKIYLQQILGITSSWTLWEDLFTQNTGYYFMFNTVGRLFTQNSW
jgi:hypothetical protein